MVFKRRYKNKIRRFTDDVLSKELRLSIREMAKNVSREITKKVIAAAKR